MSGIVGVQRRMMELGRIRLGGEKSENAPGRKLTHFRLTSASRVLLEAAAAIYGGKVAEWEGAADEGFFQLYTETATLDIILPPVFSDRDGSPTLPYSQAYELYKGRERARCCDGTTETLSAKPCLCNPDARECAITTRLNVMLPKVPGLGVWLLQSHGWNAASILPGTLDLLLMAADAHSFIPAVLRLEQRTSKKDGTTRKFAVPVIDLPNLRLEELAGGNGGLLLNGPSAPPPRPALPAAGSTLPADPSFENGQEPGFGTPPALPDQASAGEPESDALVPSRAPASLDTDVSQAALTVEPASPADDVKLMTPAKKQKLDILVGTLRDAGHITTEQVYQRCQIKPIASDYDDEGVLHYAPLRDRLSRSYGDGLIDALSKFEASITDGSYFQRRAAEVQERVGT